MQVIDPKVQIIGLKLCHRKCKAATRKIEIIINKMQVIGQYYKSLTQKCKSSSTMEIASHSTKNASYRQQKKKLTSTTTVSYRQFCLLHIENFVFSLEENN